MTVPNEEGESPSKPLEEEEEEYEVEIGYCCFCHSECNPASQSCGVCPRRMFWDGTFARMYAAANIHIDNEKKEDEPKEDIDDEPFSLSLE
jgi:hypothetical protein